MLYSPFETHKSLYKKISDLLDAGNSYLSIGKILLPTLPPLKAKGVIYRAHKKNSWTKDNEIRMILGLPKFMFVQDDPTMKPAPVCTSCGKVHTYDRACEMVVTIKQKKDPLPAWVTEAADNLARLEEQALPSQKRTYNRKGKRVPSTTTTLGSGL